MSNFCLILHHNGKQLNRLFANIYQEKFDNIILLNSTLLTPLKIKMFMFNLPSLILK